MSSSGVRYRPLRGCVFPPSEPDPALVKRAAQPPTARLELEFVYGYRGKDCRDNLLYTPEGDLLYFTAGVGVVYDRARHAQRHFVGHDNDIMCMALCPTAPVVATGQQDPPGVRDAYVLLWDHHTMRQVQLLDNAHKRGVSAMVRTAGSRHRPPTHSPHPPPPHHRSPPRRSPRMGHDCLPSAQTTHTR